MVKTQNRYKELTGQKFGRLKVIERDWEKTTSKNGWKVYWKCLCECGNTVSVRAEHLKEDTNKTKFHTRSCGCLQKEKARENGKKNALPSGEYARRCVFNIYKKRIQKKKLSFDLTRKEFDSLIDSDCHYCGESPSNLYKNRKNPAFSLKYNGIDRKDSNLGYTKDNIVPCCGTCNYMKTDLSYQEFIDKIKKIIHHLENETSIYRDSQKCKKTSKRG